MGGAGRSALPAPDNGLHRPSRQVAVPAVKGNADDRRVSEALYSHPLPQVSDRIVVMLEYALQIRLVVGVRRKRSRREKFKLSAQMAVELPWQDTYF